MSVDKPGPELYRWTCPICGKTSIRVLDASRAHSRAVATLKSHVQSSDGGGHGPLHDLPEGYDTDALADHVEQVSASG